MLQRLLCTDLHFGKREVLLLWPICFSLSAVTSSREAWNKGYCQMSISQFWGQGQEAVIGSSWRVLPLGMSHVEGSEFLGLTLSSQEESEEAEPGSPAPCRATALVQSRACCRLAVTSTKPGQTESGTACLGRPAGLPCFWGHLSDPNNKDFAHCQMHWTCQQMHKSVWFTTRLKKYLESERQ